MNKRIHALFAIMILFSLFLAACSSTAPTEPGELTPATVEPAEPGVTTAPGETEAVGDVEPEPVVLRIGTTSDPECWNVLVCANFYGYGHLVAEGLTDHGNGPGCPGVPRLAESWELSEDGKTWTIFLHEGITYSDGTPFTAQTAVDWYEWQGSTSYSLWFPETAFMESIEALDELTFQYTTSIPISISPDSGWVWNYILAPHLWGELDESTMYGFENYPPIGTGPYEVTEYKPFEYVIYDARPEYYLGKPPIERLVYQIYSTEDAIVNAILGGEIDYASLSVDAYEPLSATPNLTVVEKYPGPVHALVFNLHPGGLKHPAVEDASVREAIDYAINKQQIVDVVLLGHGVTCPTNWACGPNYLGDLNPDLTITPYDPERAKQILADAGYVDSDGDGIRETPDGQPLEFRLSFFADLPTHSVISEMVGDWLGEIGIATILEGQESATARKVVLDERDFDLALFQKWGEIDSHGGFDFYFSCWTADAGSAAANLPGWCNEEVDNLNMEYLQSSDPAARQALTYKAQEILHQTRPLIILAGENTLEVYRNDKFEFPHDTCDVGVGIASPQGLMNAVVK